MVRLAAHHERNFQLNRYALFKTFNSEMQPGEIWRDSTGFVGVLTRDMFVGWRRDVLVDRVRDSELPGSENSRNVEMKEAVHGCQQFNEEQYRVRPPIDYRAPLMS
jgi:hypothetical protein